MWPHRLGFTWSSRWMAATPDASNSRTVRMTLIAFPYPVSASEMTGTDTASAR